MWLGYLKVGRLEIANSPRVYAYAKANGVSWLQDTSSCEALEEYLPRLPESYSYNQSYKSVVSDPAPWYNPDNPDTAEFYGCVMLSADGLYGSTARTSLNVSLSGGRSVGRTYYDKREVVVRALLVAADECGLSAGLAWLGSSEFGLAVAPGPLPEDGDPVVVSCGKFSSSSLSSNQPSGDMIFWDCCPCSCGPLTGSTAAAGDETWNEVVGTWDRATRVWDIEQAVVDDFPLTIESYGQSFDGNTGVEEGCIDECVMPYRRHLRGAQVTSGPVVVEYLKNLSCGAGLVVEFTISSADASHYTDDGQIVSPAPIPPGAIWQDGVAETDTDPLSRRFGIPVLPELPHSRLERSVTRTEWFRSVVNAGDTEGFAQGMAMMYPTITVSSGNRPSGEVRLKVVQADEVLVEFYVPQIPADAEITLDMSARVVWASADGWSGALSGVVMDGDGNPIRWPGPMRPAPFQLVVDRAAETPLALGVTAKFAGVG